MTQTEMVINRMASVSESMWELAELMANLYDTDPNWNRHTEELKGAANMLLSWVVDIQREIDEAERMKDE